MCQNIVQANSHFCHLFLTKAKKKKKGGYYYPYFPTKETETEKVNLPNYHRVQRGRNGIQS